MSNPEIRVYTTQFLPTLDRSFKDAIEAANRAHRMAAAELCERSDDKVAHVRRIREVAASDFSHRFHESFGGVP